MTFAARFANLAGATEISRTAAAHADLVLRVAATPRPKWPHATGDGRQSAQSEGISYSLLRKVADLNLHIFDAECVFGGVWCRNDIIAYYFF